MTSDKDNISPNPIISDVEVASIRHQDTLNNVASILELMDELDLSDGLSPSAANGLFWINLLLTKTIQYVSDDINHCQDNT